MSETSGTAPPGKKRFTVRRAIVLVLLASLAVHLLALVIFGSVVIFRHLFQQEPQFVAPPSEGSIEPRKLEYKVKIREQQRSSGRPQIQPRLTSIAISDIALPDIKTDVAAVRQPMSNLESAVSQGVGSGLGAGSGDVGAGGLFGFNEYRPGTLVGELYDLKQTRSKQDTKMKTKEYLTEVKSYVRGGWSQSVLNRYYRAPKKLYATQIFIPKIRATEGPAAFQVEKEVQPRMWVAHYECKVSPPETGTYHFVGMGDDVLYVRFNRRLVLDATWRGRDVLKPHARYDTKFGGFPGGLVKGEPFFAEAGKWYDLEVLIGEEPGGGFFMVLLIEKQGEEYKKDDKGNPILPVFRLSDADPSAKRAQYHPHQKDGPVWQAQSPGP
jgi:hypothetical protein